MSGLRLADVTVIMATISLMTYLVFHYLEPEKPFQLTILLVVIPVTLAPLIRPLMSSFFLAISLGLFCHNALILLCTVAYRLSPFHPLAKYPGPVPNRVSKFWMAYITSSGKQHLHIRKLHEIYGDIVRTGPNELSINRADAIEPVLGAAGLRKGPYWSNRVPDGAVSALISQRDPVEHQRRRRPWARAFSSASLKDYEETVVRRSKDLVDELEKRANQVIDFNQWTSFFGFDFMGDMAFGTDFGMLRSGSDSQAVWHSIEQGTARASVIGHMPWAFRLLRLIPASTPARDRLFGLAQQWVGHRIKQGATSKDLFYHLIDEGEVEKIKPPLPVVFSDGLLAVVAGSDTTATAISALVYFLLRNPVASNRLRAEIDQYFPRGEEPDNFTKMASMPYLNACINEALRLLPPVLSGVQRCTHPGSGGKLVGPYFIPEGTNVSIHTFTLHRNPRAFSPFPDSFWPDRWLPESDRSGMPSSSEFIHDSIAFQPFSFGPAGCVGKNLAQLELRAVTCNLVKRFDFRVEEGFKLESWEEGITDCFVVSRPPLPVVLHVRE
jgi:cytochrome P450